MNIIKAKMLFLQIILLINKFKWTFLLVLVSGDGGQETVFLLLQ